MNDKTILLAQSDLDEVLTLRVLEKAGIKNRLVMTRDGVEARLAVLEDWYRRTYVLRAG